ncbi:3221_t:CDS:2 [Scutellospora calospora]|uniref:3221_t:CDS:1 n=1 Tax=Scutellospora calospora TaxID=85575 RepID=A0ACA9LBT3_9GLOM|nr:3221_t:CDS:2 [Scutellospora calospora]
MCYFLLDIILFNDRHTGINIADAINNVLSDFNIKDNTLALTTDNEFAMIVCRRLIVQKLQCEFDNIRFSYYRCVAHILNLTTKQELEMINSSVEKVQNLMLKIKVSIHFSDDLCRLYKLKIITYLKPELDIETRWNSTYYMLQKMQKIENTLNLLAADYPLIHSLYPSTDEQQKLKYSEFLDSYIGQEKYSQNIVAAPIYQKIEEYWNIMDKPSIVSAVLDPYAKLKIFNKIVIVNVKSAVQKLINQYEYQQTSPISNDTKESSIKTARKFF